MFGEDLVYSGPISGQADFKIWGWMSATAWGGGEGGAALGDVLHECRRCEQSL